MPKTEMKATTSPKPQHAVIEDTFVWHSTDPEVGEVRIPLKFKTKILRAARERQDDDLGFMFTMLDAIIPAEIVDEMDAGELMRMFRAWQEAWQERQGATFPEA